MTADSDEAWEPLDPGRSSLRDRLRWDPSRRGALVVVALVALAAVVTGLVVWHARPTPQSLPPPSAVPTAIGSSVQPTVRPSVSPSAGRITVAVAGKVRHPGVVQLPAGSRVVDAVAAAGGVAPGAHLGLLNLAALLTDGEQVVVGLPSAAGDPGGGGSAPAAGSSAPGTPVNLNTATVEQLDSLPGVGAVTAQKIVDWRTANGPFQSVDQLQDVSGIGPAKYAALAPLVTL